MHYFLCYWMISFQKRHYLGEELFTVSTFETHFDVRLCFWDISIYMKVLSNKCYICDLSAMDDGDVGLELGLVRLGEDNSCWRGMNSQPSWFYRFSETKGLELALGEKFFHLKMVNCWRKRSKLSQIYHWLRPHRSRLWFTTLSTINKTLSCSKIKY